MTSIDEIAREEGLEPPTVPEPTMDASLPNTIIFSWETPQTRIDVEGIRKDRNGVHCFLTFWTGNNGIIYGPTRLNLQSATGKTDLIKQLRDREPRSWAEYIQHVVYLTSKHLRDDGETLTAATYKPKPQPAWLLWPLIKAEMVNTCFADGGAGKSTLYTALAVSGAAGQSIIPGVQVDEPFTSLICDFEASPDDVIGAAHALARGAGLSDAWRERFIYRRFGGSLADNIETIQRIVVKHDVKLVVIDSLVGSAGSDPNDAETARVFFSAASTLPGCAVAGLTHVSKGSEDSPLGSVMYRNLPRVVWQMKRDEDSDTVGLYPNKINTLGEKPKAFGLSLETRDGWMRYVPADLGSAPSLSRKLSVSERIANLLRQGEMSSDDIANELGIATGTIRQTLNRHKGNRFTQNATTKTWGLLKSEETDATGPRVPKGPGLSRPQPATVARQSVSVAEIPGSKDFQQSPIAPEENEEVHV